MTIKSTLFGHKMQY